MAIFSSLTRNQKEAIGLLQIGTFLEYFDLFLYIHMAVLLNHLFFPQTDPYTASILTAVAFCSTWVLRPFGALLFGWIGDHIGRKHTVVITTAMMSISCIIMANLPTYAEVGITAAWTITICRILQGLSSMGEVIGAEVYLTELIKPPAHYLAVALVVLMVQFGTLSAIGVAFFVTACQMNWRSAFWIGASIAIIGTAARMRLRETPEFLLKTRKKVKQGALIEKTSKKSLLAYFLMDCSWPIWFYLVYMYCGNILKYKFMYAPEKIIQHNFKICLFQVLGFIILVFFTSKFHPFQIIKVKRYILIPLVALTPYLLSVINSPSYLLLLQAILIACPLHPAPLHPIMISNFPILRRVTNSLFMYATAHACMHILNSFSLPYLTRIWGHYGLWFTMIPVLIGFYWGVNYFEKLENKNQKPHKVHTPFLTNHDEIKLAG